MNDQMLAELFAKIGFKVDLTGVQQAKAALKNLEQQAKATGKALQQNVKLSGGGASARSLTAATQAQTKAQFAAQLQGAKLQQINQKTAASSLQTQQQQVKLAVQQQKLATATAQTQAVAAKAQLQQQAQALGNQLKQLGIANALTNAQQKAQAHAMRQQLQQHRLNRLQAGATPGRNAVPSGARLGGGLLGFGASAVGRFGGFGSAVGGLAGGSVDGALAGLAGSAGGVATALGSILGPAALVVAAFAAVEAAAYGFAREAERAANTRNQRLGQFESVGSKTPENAQRMNARFENFAQTEGLSTKDIGTDYAKLVNALSSRVGVDKAGDITEGIMRFGNSQHLSNDNMQRISVGLRQALGKGQLYSEEWTGQIAEHLGPNANQYGAEAWQRATGGHLTGEAASKAFSQDRQNRLISGDALVKFMTELGSILDSHANDGGLGDKARQTQNAWDNRISNQYQANMSKAYDDTGLQQTLAGNDGLYANFVKFLKEAQPEFVALGNASNTLITGLTGVVKLMTQAAAWMNNGESFFDPKFTQQLSASFSLLGDSLGSLWKTVTDSFGKDSLGTAAGVLKTVGEVAITVITGFVDALTMLVRGVMQITRFLQAAYYSAPLIGDKDKYAQLKASWAKDDAQFEAMVAKRFGNAPADGAKEPTQAPAPVPKVDPSAPWRSPDNSDIPMVPPVMAAPPATNPVQPAVNGKAGVTNNNTNTFNFTTGPTHITTGVHADELQDALSKANQEAQDMFASQLTGLNAPTNVSKARGN